MADNKKIFKNTVYLYARQIIVLFVSIYTTRVILQVLGVQDYGIYNVVCGFVSMFGFLNSTMANCVQRFYSVEEGHNNTNNFTQIYRTSIIVQLLSVVMVIIILEPFGTWYINHKMIIPQERLTAANWVFQSAVLSLILVFLQVPYNAAIIAKEKLDFYALVSIGDSLLKLGIVLILPYLDGDGLIVYGFLLVITSIIDFFLYYIYSIRVIPELTFKLAVYKQHLKSLLSFTGWNLLEMFAWMTQGQGVNMIMNLFFGPIVNAAQGVSVQIQNAIQSFCSNMITAFRPQIIQSYAKTDYIHVKQMVDVMSKALFFCFFILSTPFIIEQKFLLGVWLGTNVPQYTSVFTTLLLLSMYPRNFVASFSQIIHASGRIRDYQIVSAIIILSILPITYFLFRSGVQPYAVYIVNLICCCILFIACMLLLKRVFPYSIREYFTNVVLPCILLALIVVPLSYFLQSMLSEGWLRLILISLFCSFLTIMLGSFIVLNSKERSFVFSFLKKKFNV